MTSERSSGTGINSAGGGALEKRPSVLLLGLLRARADISHGLSANAIASATAALVLEHPEAVETVVHASYFLSGLLESARDRSRLPSSLADIRAAYPTVISSFDDLRLGPLLSQLTRNRIDEIRQFVAALPGGEEVQTIEIVLSILNEDIRASGGDLTAYPNVRTSHELYGKIIDSLNQSGICLDLKEDRALLAIGQRLLAALKVFTVNLEAHAQNYGKRANSREADYHGKLRVLRACAGFIQLLEHAQGYPSSQREVIEKQLANLRSSIELIEGELRTQHADKYPALQDELGLAEGEKLRRWAEHPGGPQFTPSESRDSSRSGW